MKFVWLVLGVFAARFLATAIAFPQGDGDLRWQRWLGRTILARRAIPRALGAETFSVAGAHWTPQEWAFSLVAAHATAGLAWVCFAGTIALCAVLALGIVAYHAVRRGASSRAVVFCTALAGIGLFASFGVRVQVVAWPLLALYLLLLDAEGPWAFAAIVVAALWSNLHASAMLAPVLAAVATLGTAVDERGVTLPVRRMLAITGGSAIALCCNPFGWDLPLYALTLFSSPIREQISEWQPTVLSDVSFAAGALPLLLIGLLFFADRGGRRVRDLLLLGATTYLMLGAVRNIAVFVWLPCRSLRPRSRAGCASSRPMGGGRPSEANARRESRCPQSPPCSRSSWQSVSCAARSAHEIASVPARSHRLRVYPATVVSSARISPGAGLRWVRRMCVSFSTVAPIRIRLPCGPISIRSHACAAIGARRCAGTTSIRCSSNAIRRSIKP